MEQQNTWAIVGAIVIAGVLIAGAVIFGGNDTSDEPAEREDIVVAPVSADEHILGNPAAPIKIVEYSDIDCPFCSQFHQTMHQIIDTYGADGQVAWVYRHFPLDQLHPHASAKAVASECVAELGGNEGFWTFIDILFERDEDVTELATIAGEIGVDEGAFQTCLDEGRHLSAVQEDFSSAIEAGGTGTPYSILVVEGNDPLPLNGAQPYQAIEQIIEGIVPQI